VQLARETGARVIGTGRAADRQTVLGLGAHYFVDLHHDGLAGIGEVDMVFDVIGGRILDRSAALVRAGGTLVSVAEPPRVQPDDGRAVFFVVESDRVALAALERRVRGGQLRLLVGTTCRLEQAPAAFDPADRIRGKAVIRVIDDVQPATNGSIPDGGGS
jgi:NADPH:quinone reductase-like Zn-dependent oxidoreductase